MPRRLDLWNSWAKLDRAKSHVGILRAAICLAGNTTDPNAIPIPLRRQYEPPEGAVIYRPDRLIEIDDEWPLIFGDAIQNFRAALDHLMYQFAIVRLGRVPTEAEAKQIQFPDIRKLEQIPGHRFLKHIGTAHLDRLKRLQPYYRRYQRKKGELHPLPKLIKLSNIDKHRRLHLLVHAILTGNFTNAPIYRDCQPMLRFGVTGKPESPWYLNFPRYPRPNDEILRIPVRVIGPNPDVEVPASLTGQVVTGKLGPVIPMLDGFGQYVGAVLTAFQPRR